MHLLHSVAVQNQDPAVDAVLSFELAVNPLSVVLLHMRPLTDTGTLANYTGWFETLACLNRINILHRGMSIFSMTGQDAAALSVMRHGCAPWLANPSLTNNDRICATLPIFMGRRAYDGKSCFPASRSGELILELDVDVADTGYDDLQFTVETIELLGAKPTEYERKVQLARTFAATGLNDVDLPVGNLIRGMMLFGTTGFTGAAPVPSWGRIKTVVDGVEIGYSGIDFESAYSLPCLLGGRSLHMADGHTHVENINATYLQLVATQIHSEGGVEFNNHCFLDLDPLMNDELSIDTANVSRFQIRADAETADAVRVTAIERVKF